ncbi:Hypp2271 [Branchiostoma lanceolatum]|uniref:Hypp2271 protein n=1 Tax=Branchiostoma lanceolatum TaxID=7740 RepID=A0A8K0EM80_BRALA|nr:Hypp2271 [Branchiostoma lanceolatum]
MDVKMQAAAGVQSSGIESLPNENQRPQGKVEPLKNGQMLGQKTAMNGKVKGVVDDVKEQLQLQTAKLENGTNYEETTLTPLEEELKELRMRVEELRPYRDKAQKMEKAVQDLHEALKQSKSKVLSQQEQLDRLQRDLGATQRKGTEATLAKEAYETAARQEIHQLQEELRSSQLQLQLEKVAKIRAWADIETLKAGTKRLWEEHSDFAKAAQEELLHLTERVKEQAMLLGSIHPLLPGVDELTECQCHLPELTSDDVLLTSHMRECQSCQRVVTPYLFHIKTCRKFNCEHCAHVRRLYCGHVFTCEREECDVTGCVETREVIQGSQLSPEELQNDKQFKDRISAHLRKSTSPFYGTECGGLFRAFQQTEYWAFAVGPVNLHRHQVNNRLLQMCRRVLPTTVSLAEQAVTACLSHSDLWSRCGHRKRCLVCNICLTSLRSCASCTLPKCEICVIAAMACARHSINCTNANCKILFCYHYRQYVREGDTVYPSPIVLALFRESILMLNRSPIAASLL